MAKGTRRHRKWLRTKAKNKRKTQSDRLQKGSDDSDSEFLGSCAGWTPNDRSLRKYVPKDIKQEKHQRDKTLGTFPAKRAKSDPIEIDDFDLGDEDNIKDFDCVLFLFYTQVLSLYQLKLTTIWFFCFHLE